MANRIIECPSGLKLMVKNLTLKQANYFVNSKLIQNGRLLDEILHAGVVSVQDPGPYEDFPTKPSVKDWDQVLTGDRYYAGLEIRRETYNDEVSFKENCANCGSLMSVVTDLDKMNIYDLPEDSLNALVEGRKLTTEVMNGKYIMKWHLPTGDDEKRTARYINENSIDDEDEQLTISLAMRIDSIEQVNAEVKTDAVTGHVFGSKLDDNDKVRFLNSLGMADVMEIMAQMEEMDCGVELEDVHTCEHCNAQNEVKVPFLSPAMWLPKRRLKRRARAKRGNR